MLNYKGSPGILLYYQTIINFEKKVQTRKGQKTWVVHLGRISQPIGFVVGILILRSYIKNSIWQNYVSSGSDRFEDPTGHKRLEKYHQKWEHGFREYVIQV